MVRDRDGETIGLHRTYLSEESDGQIGKAAVAKPRMMLGRVAGGAVRLGDHGRRARRSRSARGSRPASPSMTARPGLSVWATLSTSGLEQVELPAGARRAS